MALNDDWSGRLGGSLQKSLTGFDPQSRLYSCAGASGSIPVLETGGSPFESEARDFCQPRNGCPGEPDMFAALRSIRRAGTSMAVFPR